jgi:dTDP-4-dehydrorhamnose reductase
MKILVTGANGLLGQHVVKMLLQNGHYHVIATGKGQCRLPFNTNKNFEYAALDITDEKAVHNCLLSYKPAAIIHAAAITQPDPCELDTITCWKTNVTATQFLVDAATIINAYFLYISTDFVFDGLHGPYKETDTTNPVNFYGTSKLAAEKLVVNSLLQWSIVRTVLVFGNILVGNRSNIISWVKESLTQNKPIKVVTDQWRTPTYVEDLATGILLVLQKQAIGIYHIAGKQGMSPYDMAIATANYLQLNTTLITKVTADTFTQPAVRPLITGFVIDKAIVELNYQPISFEVALKAMLG